MDLDLAGLEHERPRLHLPDHFGGGGDVHRRPVAPEVVHDHKARLRNTRIEGEAVRREIVRDVDGGLARSGGGHLEVGDVGPEQPRDGGRGDDELVVARVGVDERGGFARVVRVDEEIVNLAKSRVD
jgi:hypothetical protein